MIVESSRRVFLREAALRRSHVKISKCAQFPGLLTVRHSICSSRRQANGIQVASRTFSTSRDLKNDTQSQILEKYKTSFSFPAATHAIEALSSGSIGEDVVLHGFLGARHDLSKKLSFAPLLSNDLSHSVQIISLAKTTDAGLRPSHASLKAINPLSPVWVRGKLKERKPSKDVGAIKKIQEVELELEEIHCLNEFPEDIIVADDTIFPPEQRNLQIRTDKSIRDALAFRAKAARLCRSVLDEQGFLEIETPMLFKSTPEGAREFLVPTRTKGLAYALPQSPQQYKQILMGSGISKYYQIARCFRDEGLRADRQPEFTQLDLEMSFAQGEDVMNCIETLLKRLWTELLGMDFANERFQRIKYEDAMAKYGSDKPDIRLGMEIHKIDYLLPVDLVSKIGPLLDPTVEVMKLQVSDTPAETRKFVSQFMDSPEAKPFLENPEGQPGIFIYDSTKPLQGLQPFGFEAAEHLEEILQLEDGDLIVLQAREKGPFAGGSTPMGNLRLALHRAAVAQELIPAPNRFEFLWITDFPLFSPSNDTDPGQGGAAGISSTHHPFTAPKTAGDVEFLLSDPTRVTGEHYDIVVNGVELGGGSRRIHNAAVQEIVLRDVLKMSEERLQDFRHLLEVLRAGCPPHAGLALGFDRLIAVMLGKQSVRDVIAFPKNGKGEDMLVKSPNPITKEQLETYHLQLKS